MTPEDDALVRRMEALTRTASTRYSYRNHFDKYLAFCGWTPSELLAQEPRAVEDRLLDFYQAHEDWSRGRVNIMKCSVNLFGEANEREYIWKRLKRALPQGDRRPRDMAPTVDEGRQILKYADLRERAMLLTAASGGLRHGALVSLKLQMVSGSPCPGRIVTGFMPTTFSNDSSASA